MATAERSNTVPGNEKFSAEYTGRQDTPANDSPTPLDTGVELPNIDSISTDIFPPPPQAPPASTHGASHTSPQKSPQNPYALVTLVMINEDYVQAAIVLAASIRRCFEETTEAFATGGAAFAEKVAPYGGFPPLSRLPDLVVMVDNAVGAKARRSLSKFFDRVVEVTIIEADARQCGKQGGKYNAHLYENWISASFTKFHFLGFDEYKRVMFLDADQLLMGDISHLFRAPSHVRLQECASEKEHCGQVEKSESSLTNGFPKSQDIRKEVNSATNGQQQYDIDAVRSCDPSEYDDFHGPGGVECPAAICSAIGTDRDGVAKFGKDAEMHGRLLSRQCVKHAIDMCYGMRGSIMLVEPNKEHLREIQTLLQRQGFYGNRAQGHLGADERLMSERYLDQWHHLHHRYGWISWRAQDKNDVAPTVIHFLTAKPWSWSEETWPDFRVWNEAARRLLTEDPDIASHFRPLQDSVDDDASLGMHALYASVNRTLQSERKKKEEEEFRKLQQRREYRGIVAYRQPPVRRTRSHQDLERNWLRADGSRVNLMSGTALNSTGRKHVGSFTAAMLSVQCGAKPRLMASKSQPGTGSRSRAGAYVPPHLRKKRTSAATVTGRGGSGSALSAGSSPMNMPPPEDEPQPSKPIDPFPNKPIQHHSLRSPLNKSPTGMRAQRSPPIAVSMRVSITSVTHVRTSPNAVSVMKVSVRGGGAPPDLHLPPPAAASQRQNGVQHREENGFKIPVVTRHKQTQRSQTRPRADAAYASTKVNTSQGERGSEGEPGVTVNDNTHQNGNVPEKSSGSSRFTGNNKGSSSRFSGGGNKGSSRFGGSGNSPARFGGSGNSPSRFGGNSRNNSPRLSPQEQPKQPSGGSSRFSGKKPQAKKSLNLENSKDNSDFIDTAGTAQAAQKNPASLRPSSRDEGTLSAAMAAAKSSQAQAATCR